MNQSRREPLSRRIEPPVPPPLYFRNDNRCGKQQPWRRVRSPVGGIVAHTLFEADDARLVERPPATRISISLSVSPTFLSAIAVLRTGGPL